MKTVLVIVDGAGYADHASPGNAVTPQTLPVWHQAMGEHGFALLEASGQAVGLDCCQAGNSEIGHMTIGAGFVVPSTMQRIGTAYENGEWGRHPHWRDLATLPRLHVVGLLSDAGTHGHWHHLLRSAKLAKAAGIAEVIVHPVLDGLDSPAGSAPALLTLLAEGLASLEGVRLGLVMGRASFCDRSGDMSIPERYRVALMGEVALPAYTSNALSAHLAKASEASFPAHVHDERDLVEAGETILLTQHRADRARQVAITLSKDNCVYSLIELEGAVAPEHVFFPNAPLGKGLAFELKARGLTSVRIAERCKFPHVTYFFNGLNPGLEGREICLPSVPEAELAHCPEMSAHAITDAVLDAISSPEIDLVTVNIANLDQIGHLGQYGLAVTAAHSVDICLRRIRDHAHAVGACMIVTSDHGNADRLVDEKGRPFGSHTPNPVPFAVIPPAGRGVCWQNRTGTIAQVAPTVLTLLGISPPAYMEPSLASLS